MAGLREHLETRAQYFEEVAEPLGPEYLLTWTCWRIPVLACTAGTILMGLLFWVGWLS